MMTQTHHFISDAVQEIEYQRMRRQNDAIYAALCALHHEIDKYDDRIEYCMVRSLFRKANYFQQRRTRLVHMLTGLRDLYARNKNYMNEVSLGNEYNKKRRHQSNIINTAYEMAYTNGI